MIRKLALALAGAAFFAAIGPATAQEPPAPGVSPRVDAIRKAGVLRVGVLANAPWLVENTTGGGEKWSGPAGGRQIWRTSPALERKPAHCCWSCRK